MSDADSEKENKESSSSMPSQQTSKPLASRDSACEDKPTSMY